MLLADTKFEFGDDDHGVLTLADEVLTPDSSRYWDAAAYAEGRRGVSFDKQIVRDWLTAHWDGDGRRAGPPGRDRAAHRRPLPGARRPPHLLIRCGVHTDRWLTRHTSRMSDLLAAATVMGAVTLEVADLDAMTRYYTEGVGLDVARHRARRGRRRPRGCGVPRPPPLGRPVARPRSAAGLYHTAMLFDSRAALAAAVYSVARATRPRSPGRATTSSRWRSTSTTRRATASSCTGTAPRRLAVGRRRRSRMGTLALDPNAFLQQHLRDDDRRRPASQRSGMCTSRSATSRPRTPSTWTCVGFEVTARFGEQALFVSAGGYHHHVGMNTWESRGAGPRTPALGLGQVALRLPDADALGALRTASASLACGAARRARAVLRGPVAQRGPRDRRCDVPDRTR